MKKLIVREESVRNVFYELLPQYNEFILNPPSLYRDGNDRIIDDISSMLNYLMNFSSEEQAESVLRRFTDEAGLNGNVKDIFIGFIFFSCCISFNPYFSSLASASFSVRPFLSAFNSLNTSSILLWCIFH